MSITIHQRDPQASIRIGGENDIDGRPGHVILDVHPPAAPLKPSTARQVAAKLTQFARAAVPGSPDNLAASEAARVLGAGSASRAGRASQAKISPEERKRRNKAAAIVRWERYRAAKGSHAAAK
jgi:hypothetical protein